MNRHINQIETAFQHLAENAPIKLVDVIYEPYNEAKGQTRQIDALVTLYIENQLIEFEVEQKGEVRQHTLKYVEDYYNRRTHPFLLIADRIYPNQQLHLKKLGINYLDISGNCYIKEGSILIAVSGQKLVDANQGRKKTISKNGLKVIFYFLTNEDAVNHTYRQIAEGSGVALGSITAIIESLHLDGYIINVDRNKKKLIKKDDLLTEWIEDYRKILKPTLLIGNYYVRPEKLYQWMEHATDSTVWGGEAAAQQADNWLRAEHLTIYTQEKEQTLRENLQLIKREGGNLTIYEKFWHHPAPLREMQTCPPLLILADLMDSDDPRVIDATKRIYDKFLKNGSN